MRGKLLGVLLVVAVLAVELGITSALFRPSWALFEQPVPARADVAGRGLERIAGMLEPGSPVGEVEAAMREGVTLLFHGAWPLPSPGVDAAQARRVEAARALVQEGQRNFASALEGYALDGEDEALRARARDLQSLVEQAFQLSLSLGELTRQCQPDSLGVPPCDGLLPLLDAPLDSSAIFLPLSAWGQDTLVTQPLSTGECVAVFGLRQGLTFSLRSGPPGQEAGPWMETLDIPGLWALQWRPVTYVEQWDICNTGGRIERTVTRRPGDDLPAGPRW